MWTPHKQNEVFCLLLVPETSTYELFLIVCGLFQAFEGAGGSGGHWKPYNGRGQGRVGPLNSQPYCYLKVLESSFFPSCLCFFFFALFFAFFYAFIFTFYE